MSDGGCACDEVRYRMSADPVIVHCCHCLNCQRQIALFSEYGTPWLWFARAGTLDDPSAVAPDVHIFTRSKLDWVTLPESAQAFEVLYDPQDVWPQASLGRAAAQRAGWVRELRMPPRAGRATLVVRPSALSLDRGWGVAPLCPEW